jgi:hypothetical protein
MAFLPIYAPHSNARFRKGCSEIWNRSLTQINLRIIKTSCRICEGKLAGHISAQIEAFGDELISLNQRTAA